MLITALYAVPLTLLFVLLSVRTIRVRRRAGVAIGSGDSGELARASRAHGNFAEYVPLALLLMYFQEVLAAPFWWLHALGTLLVAGRVVHAWGISREPEDYRYRVTGMSATFTVLGVSALAIVLLSL
ncbi:MAG: MAPEG family protein [Pseudomonadales bacterium]